MWLVSEFSATALYSLKISMATSSGGKTLLVPTPYALKMALLDVAIRKMGASKAETLWPTLRDLQVAYRAPKHAVVTNLFTRVLKPNRSEPPPGSPHAGPLGKTIGYREYVHFSGPFGLALAAGNGDNIDWLPRLLAGLNYLGKRGGFVQLMAPPKMNETLPQGYVRLNAPNGQLEFDRRGLLQMLDDCGPRMTYAQADVFSGENVRMGRERLSYPVVLPYHLVRASKSYSYYERLDER
jgi:hypothetical protein